MQGSNTPLFNGNAELKSVKIVYDGTYECYVKICKAIGEPPMIDGFSNGPKNCIIGNKWLSVGNTIEIYSDGSFVLHGAIPTKLDKSHRTYNVGSSNYSEHKIQPWDIWEEYDLDPWRADIVKRILRDKEGDDPILDLEKIKHICDKLISLHKSGYFDVNK